MAEYLWFRDKNLYRKTKDLKGYYTTVLKQPNNTTILIDSYTIRGILVVYFYRNNKLFRDGKNKPNKIVFRNGEIMETLIFKNGNIISKYSTRSSPTIKQLNPIIEYRTTPHDLELEEFPELQNYLISYENYKTTTQY